jgi:hypothetical protein
MLHTSTPFTRPKKAKNTTTPAHSPPSTKMTKATMAAKSKTVSPNRQSIAPAYPWATPRVVLALALDRMKVSPQGASRAQPGLRSAHMKEWLARMKVVSRDRRWSAWRADPVAFVAVLLCEFVVLAALWFVPYWLFPATVADAIFWVGLMALALVFWAWVRSGEREGGQPRAPRS